MVVTPRRWIGRAVIAIAVLHTLFGLAAFHGTLAGLAAEGAIASVGADPMRGAVVWFLLAGFFMATTGIAIDQLEAQGLHDRLGSLGWCLLATVLLGIALMPVSGFWLMVLPAAFCIRSARATRG